MKKLLAALLMLCCTAAPALAQTAVTLPIAANAVADLGNGPIKVRMIAGNASIFTSQSSGLGSTSGSSTTLTLTATPATPPLVGGLISGAGIVSGTSVTAYAGTTVTLSTAAVVSGGTAVSWGAACPSSVGSNPAIQASPQAGYYLFYTQARVCAVSPGGPVNTLLVAPIYYDQGAGGIAVGAPISGTCPSGYNLYSNAGAVGCQSPAGSGTVTSLSVISANGVSGSVANPTTTPAITLSCGSGSCAPTASPTLTGTSTFNLSGLPNPSYNLESGTGVLVVGQSNQESTLSVDAFGTTTGGAVQAGFPIIMGRYARGTASAPTSVGQFDTLMSLQYSGYVTGSGFINAALAFDTKAAENFTSGAHGVYHHVNVVQEGTTNAVVSMSWGPIGGVTIGNYGLPRNTIPPDPGLNNLLVMGGIVAGTTANFPTAPITATPQTATLPTPVTGALLHLIGANTTSAAAQLNSYGASSFIEFQRADGTLGSETALATNTIGGIAWSGYNGAAYSGSAATLNVAAVGTWSSGVNQGTQFVFGTTPQNSVTKAVAASIMAGVIVGSSSTDPGAGNLIVNGTAAIQTLPTSAGSGGLYVCVDSSGNLYKKSACP